MDFKEAVNAVKSVLRDIGNINIEDNYDGLLIKKLESSNTLDEGRSTNQTHIAMTGRQMDIFPYLRSDSYFDDDVNDNDLKKYFVTKLPVFLSSTNIAYLRGDEDTNNRETIQTNTSVVRSKRANQAEQIQISILKFDGEPFISFRKLLHIGSYLIILKRKERFEYEFYGVKNNYANIELLQSLNNKFYFSRTNTGVDIQNFNSIFEDKTDSFSCGFPRNRIIFGAPGTGKSYTFNKESIGSDDNQEEDYLLKNGGEYERVTFHPDYSYAQFVGTYKPTTSNADNNFIPLLKDIKSLDDLTESKFNELANKISNEIGGNGSRTLLLLLGLKFPDAKIKRQITDIAQATTDISLSPDSQINYAIEAAKYLRTESSGDIIYEYVPGPFMRTLVKALKNKKSGNIKPHLLLIEEINRANVAAVFGDVFQLLDRDDSNQSEYPIQASEDMKKYLVKELDGDISDYAQIRIPDNMFIWATMNSADQGVFPMDTAFKRRWDFTYQGINEGENDIESFNHKMGGSQVSVNWNDLRKAINAELITYNINEDKLMGAHFVKKESLKDKETFDKTFKSKVIMYLFDDAAKQKRPSLFSGVESPRSFKLYSDICEAYDEIGIGIFSDTIRVKFDNQIDADIDFEEI